MIMTASAPAHLQGYFFVLKGGHMYLDPLKCKANEAGFYSSGVPHSSYGLLKSAVALYFFSDGFDTIARMLCRQTKDTQTTVSTSVSRKAEINKTAAAKCIR
jgi:hypothetical protein